jgi:hypothetical protein
MIMLRRSFFALALLAAASAAAQNAPPATVRGTIETISADGATLGVKARNGEPAIVRLTPGASVTLVVPASLSDVKPGAYVGVAALPGDDGAMKAMEVHVFPEAMRGAGEGFRPFDLAPGSSMTNGALSARIDGVSGPTLTVTYAGGQQTIHLDASTPIVSFAPGARADVKVGAAMVARGERAADGAIDAARILVGKDGLTPPM